MRIGNEKAALGVDNIFHAVPQWPPRIWKRNRVPSALLRVEKKTEGPLSDVAFPLSFVLNDLHGILNIIVLRK